MKWNFIPDYYVIKLTSISPVSFLWQVDKETWGWTEKTTQAKRFSNKKAQETLREFNWNNTDIKIIKL